MFCSFIIFIFTLKCNPSMTANIFVCFVHCYSSRTQKSTFNIVNAQIFVEFSFKYSCYLCFFASKSFLPFSAFCYLKTEVNPWLQFVHGFYSFYKLSLGFHLDLLWFPTTWIPSYFIALITETDYSKLIPIGSLIFFFAGGNWSPYKSTSWVQH